jgi:hypothetical protein
MIKSIGKIVELSLSDLMNEPKYSICSSDTIFFGIFSSLRDILQSPNMSCIGLINAESIVCVKTNSIYKFFNFVFDSKHRYFQSVKE